MFLEVKLVVLYKLLPFDHDLLVNDTVLAVRELKVDYLVRCPFCRAGSWKSHHSGVRTTRSSLFVFWGQVVSTLSRFPIFTCSSFRFGLFVFAAADSYPLIVRESFFVVWCPLGHLLVPYPNEVVYLYYLSGCARDLAWVDNTQVLLTAALIRHYWFVVVLWRRCRHINRGTLSRPRFGVTATPSNTILSICRWLTGCFRTRSLLLRIITA